MAQHAYFDESGNFGFRFHRPNVSSHFVVGSILIDDSSLSKIASLADTIADKYFGKAEIKSNSVGPDDDRRLAILNDILSGDLFVYAMVFDKRRMKSKGLVHKRSFYKFLNRTSYEQLAISFPNLRLIADEHGTDEFMNSFKHYISENFASKTLFGQVEFGFVNSSSDRLIQLADFVVGSLARCFDLSILSPRREEIMDLMNRSGKLLPIFEWPTRLTSYSPRETELALSQLDDKVLSLSIKLAEKFIAENAHGKADHVAEQVATVRILLQHARYGKRNEFLETSKIIGQFASHPHLQVSLKAFGRMIIGPLRDDGVLVTSGPRGYRLVSSVSDLRQFVEYYHSFLAPMLKRISYYRSIVMLGTKNSLDILAGRKFAYLRDYYKTQSHSLRRRT